MNLSRTLVLPLTMAVFAAPAAADDLKVSPKALGPHTVKVVNDLPYKEGADADPVKNKLDLYLPQGVKEFPVLFFVHGGTWKSGDRKVYPKFGELIASHGIGTVVISYRLSPKVQHPAHIQDVARAFAWACEHIGEYGGRTDQLFLCGHSAGGHLVALLATDESFLKAEKRSLKDVKGVIAISGVYRIVPVGPLANAFGTDLKATNRASPVNNVNGKHPPFLVIYADRDLPTLGAMAEEMVQTLKKSRCDVRLLKVEDRDHISIMTSLLKEEDPTRTAVLDFVKKHAAEKGSTADAKR